MRILLLGVLTATLPGFSPHAGVIRHDRPDSLYLAHGAAPQFAPVGRVNSAAGICIGSGTLIAPRYFITAAHVVSVQVDGRPVHKHTDSLFVAFGDDTIGVARVVLHPGYWDPSVPSTADAQARKGIDVALLELKRPPRRVTPARIGYDTEISGRVAHFVGYGTAGTARTFLTDPVPPGVKRGGTNVIDSLGAVFRNRKIPSFNLVSDFDGQGIAGANRFGSADPTDLELQPAGGDSGGGVFVEQNGAWLLVGVFHGSLFFDDLPSSAGLYGTITFAVHVNPIREWIRGIVQ